VGRFGPTASSPRSSRAPPRTPLRRGESIMAHPSGYSSCAFHDSPGRGSVRPPRERVLAHRSSWRTRDRTRCTALLMAKGVGPGPGAQPAANGGQQLPHRDGSVAGAYCSARARRDRSRRGGRCPDVEQLKTSGQVSAGPDPGCPVGGWAQTGLESPKESSTRLALTDTGTRFEHTIAYG
jgi:hypothetical protein